MKVERLKLTDLRKQRGIGEVMKDVDMQIPAIRVDEASRTGNSRQDSEGLRLRAYRDAVGICTIGYGHTHEAEQHREGKTLVLNPGALYRANPHSIAVVELDTMEATIIPL